MSVLESLRDAIQPEDPEQPSPSTPTIGVDDALHVLSNQRRRYIVDILARIDGTIQKGDLAELVAARENQKRVDHLHGKERKRVYVALHQDTLPKLDRDDVIDYDDPEVEATERVPVLSNAKQQLARTLTGESE